MNKINPNYPATAVVNALALPDNNDPLIGKTVRFKRTKGMGTVKRDYNFEVVGRQRVWGYDENGKYTMIDGYRGIAIGFDDQFGSPFSRADVKIVKTN